MFKTPRNISPRARILDPSGTDIDPPMPMNASGHTAVNWVFTASASGEYTFLFEALEDHVACRFFIYDVQITHVGQVLDCEGVQGYRYGFNGMEKDDELKGAGNSYDFGARMYDSRLGRWLTRDPASSHYPNLSSYSYVANSVMIFVDPTGCVIEIAPGLSEEKQKYAKEILSKLSEDKPNLYKYFNELRYHPESKKFLSLGDEGYDEAFDVIIHVTVMDIDGKDGEKERMEAHAQKGTQISMNGGADMHLEAHVERTENWEQGKTSNDNKLFVRHPDGSTESIEIASPKQAREIDEMLNKGVIAATNLTNRIKLNNLNGTSGAHVIITLDDFISGNKTYKGQVLGHELGHIEGWINNPIEAIFYGSCDKGHCNDYSGGENAINRETNDKKPGQ